MRLSEIERRAMLERLFAEHYAAVLAYALRRAPRAVAEDVASETFVVAARRIEDMPAVALPWLYGVARRVLANERRGEARREQLTRQLGFIAEARLADVVRGDAQQLLAALLRLAEPDREALMLTAWEGLSSAEAAAVVDCSPVAMRARLSRARRRLARLLNDDEPLMTGPESVSRGAAGGVGCGVVERSN